MPKKLLAFVLLVASSLLPLGAVARATTTTTKPTIQIGCTLHLSRTPTIPAHLLGYGRCDYPVTLQREFTINITFFLGDRVVFGWAELGTNGWVFNKATNGPQAGTYQLAFKPVILPVTRIKGNWYVFPSLIAGNAHGNVYLPAITILVTSPLTTSGTAFHKFHFQLSATMGTAPYTWDQIGGKLPHGLTLSPTGVISGLPSQPGTYQVTLRVSSVHHKTSASFPQTITITKPATGRGTSRARPSTSRARPSTSRARPSPSTTGPPATRPTVGPGPPIKVGSGPYAGGPYDIAITPNGKTAYVVGKNSGGPVFPIDTVTNWPGPPIKVGTPGTAPYLIAITPNGKTAYVVGGGSGFPSIVTPINTATNEHGLGITIANFSHLIGNYSSPDDIAITPNGKTVYVVSRVMHNGDLAVSGTVTPVATATNKPGPRDQGGLSPDDIAITPNGETAYVPNPGSGTVTPIDTATNKPGPTIQVGAGSALIAITPNGKTAYLFAVYAPDNESRWQSRLIRRRVLKDGDYQNSPDGIPSQWQFQLVIVFQYHKFRRPASQYTVEFVQVVNAGASSFQDNHALIESGEVASRAVLNIGHHDPVHRGDGSYDRAEEKGYGYGSNQEVGDDASREDPDPGAP